jgi:hypothetical protein
MSFDGGEKKHHRDCTHYPESLTKMYEDARGEIERLRDGIDAIRQYGSDTLSGPTARAEDTRDWQRASVLEMTNRSVRILDGKGWLAVAPKEE